MKKIITLIFLLFFLYPADKACAKLSQEQKLERVGYCIDTEIKTEAQRKQAEEYLKSQFSVKDEQLKTLRDKDLGYGEIGIIFAFSSQMPEGVNNDNVKKVLKYRRDETKHGWGHVARSLKLSLNQALSQANQIKATLVPTSQRQSNPK